MRKKGITLATLVITIAILVILSGVVIINARGIIQKTELAKFGEELKAIEDIIKEYYISNGRFPVIEEKKFSAEQVVSLNASGFDSELQQEIEKNDDEDSTFYEIDYEAIKVTLKDRGLENTPDDIYIVSSASNRVYYVKGLQISDEIYFSTAHIADITVVK